MDKTRNILQRINAVRRSNEYIKRSKTIEVGGSYTVATHDDVTNQLRDSLVEQGIIVVPMLDGFPVAVQDTGMVQGAKAIPIIRLEAVFIVRFMNEDDPKDFIDVRVPAHALDSGDKAPGKAMSYAVKYAMLKVFSIVTGEDDERRTEDLARQAGITGLTEKEFTDWQKRIDEVATVADGNKVWKELKEACDKLKDGRSKTMLRAYLSSVMTKKGIQSGKLGGKDAAPAHAH